MARVEKLQVKLIVDKEKNRVVFAESDKDFVDILFSFLTLPLGTIIRRIGKKSSLGCFNRLYESIENLDREFLETEACRNMLLQPRSAAERHCEDLKVNVDDLKPRRIYICPGDDCPKTYLLYSRVPGVRCPCGKTMDSEREWQKMTYLANIRDGVFFKGGPRKFMVSDGFTVITRASISQSLALLQMLEIGDGSIFEERFVEVGEEEVLNLLERSLTSMTPLSDVFLPSKLLDAKCLDQRAMKNTEVETLAESDSINKIELKLLVNKENDDVLCAEADGDFINLLFSFLTFPLGSVVQLLDRNSSIYCADNLYKNVEAFVGKNEGLIKLEECKSMLLQPKLPELFGCSNQILKIDEMPSRDTSYLGVVLNAVNPKLPDLGTECGGKFVSEPMRFLVTCDLVVTTMSSTGVVNIINRLKVPITSLEERIVIIGEAEALNILKASVISDNALSTALSSKKRRKNRISLA